MYDKQIRSYYLDLKEVSDGGILSFPNKAQVWIYWCCCWIAERCTSQERLLPVDDESARKAILKYFNIDVTQSNFSLGKLQFRKFIFKGGNYAERMLQAKSMQCDFFWSA